MNGTYLISSLLLAALMFASASAQSSNPATDSDSLRKVLTIQPDYTAVQRFSFSEGSRGFGAASKVVKMGSRQAEIREDSIFISERGKPLLKIFPGRREYSELELPAGGDFNLSPEELAKQSDTTFKFLGTEKVGQYDCLKIEVGYQDERLKEMKFLFWETPALRNLVIKSEISLGTRVKFLFLLEDISLGANQSLFRIPAGYKKVTDSEP